MEEDRSNEPVVEDRPLPPTTLPPPLFPAPVPLPNNELPASARTDPVPAAAAAAASPPRDVELLDFGYGSGVVIADVLPELDPELLPPSNVKSKF